MVKIFLNFTALLQMFVFNLFNYLFVANSTRCSSVLPLPAAFDTVDHTVALESFGDS